MPIVNVCIIAIIMNELITFDPGPKIEDGRGLWVSGKRFQVVYTHKQHTSSQTHAHLNKEINNRRALKKAMKTLPKHVAVCLGCMVKTPALMDWLLRADF